MAGKIIAVTPKNVICEVIYRLYRNRLNEQYGVDCEILEVDELLSVFHILNSGCSNVDEIMECIDVDLYDNNFVCDSTVTTFSCVISATVVPEELCTPPEVLVKLK